MNKEDWNDIANGRDDDHAFDIKLTKQQREAFEMLVGEYYDRGDQRSKAGDDLFYWIRDNIPMTRKLD